VAQTQGGRKPTFLLDKTLPSQPQQESPGLRQLVASVAEREGFELIQVEVCGQGRGRLLRVYLDHPGGIGLTECERASRALSAALDEDQALGSWNGPYTLEVSSPGLDRPLTKPGDFERFAGKRVRIRTREPIAGSRNWLGTLAGAGAEGVHLKPERGCDRSEEELVVAWGAMQEARLAPEWSRPGNPRRVQR